MRQIFIAFILTLFTTMVSKAQVGLENVVIETYYVANAADIAFSGVDPLPTGAVTYRMYVDMAPGWELQAIFGATNVGTGEVDTMVIRSTAPFWNHTDFGALYGYGVQASRLDDNTVGLDSWFSTGRSSGSTGGTSAVMEVLPTEDSNGAAPTHPHSPVGLLSHNDPLAGLPLTTEDGNIPFTSTITWTATPGIEGILDPIFNNANSSATEALVSDGALGVTVSLVGPTAANRVCIGQFTTGGVFSGKINLQLREIATNLVEQYVAETPQSGQFTHSSLIWGPNSVPTVDITSPANGTDFPAASMVTINATAADADGSITQVEFFADGVSIGVDNTSPYSIVYTAGTITETITIEAVATDNDGAEATDAIDIDILGNNPPVVNLTAPTNAITGTTVNISATATDTDGITQVQFYFNNVLVSTDLTAPYEASFTATPAGTWEVKAVATDGLGATAFDAQNIVVANNQAPTVSITAPANGAFVPEGAVNVTANAADVDGTVAQVEFFANGISIGVDATAPYAVSWNAVFVGPFGDVDLTAVASDNLGLNGNSAVVGVNVINPAGAPYIVSDVEQECNEDNVCMPITAITAIDNVIGYDIVLTWDNTKVFPTGQVTKLNDLLDADLFETDNSIDFANEEMLISVFLDVDAPFGTTFEGLGDLICVEFAKRPSFDAVDTTLVEVIEFQESYFAGVVEHNAIQPGEFTTFRNTIMTSNIEFWEDNSPIGYDGTNLVTTIQANNSIDCNLASAAGPAALVGPVVNPDANGVFSVDLEDGIKISINKNIAATTDVQELVNGFDALMTRRLLVDDAAFVPNVFQVVAMDVNRDGVISAGDVSQINQRAVLILDEFRQAWNYNADGTQTAAYAPSKDWQFIDESTIFFNPNYQVSSTFPQDNGVGFSKHRVPKIPFCLVAPVAHFATCPVIEEETYIGVMMGDVNGNWRNTTNLLLRQDDAVNVEFENAVYTDEYVDVPVTFTSNDAIYSIDLNLEVNDKKLAFHTLVAGDMQAVGHFNEGDGKLRITSNSLAALNTNTPSMMVRFIRLSESSIQSSDVISAAGYLNGDKVNVNVGSSFGQPAITTLNVYPNPAAQEVFVTINEDVTAELVDMNGRVIMAGIVVPANTRQRLDLTSLTSGVYTIRVQGATYTSAQRIVVAK